MKRLPNLVFLVALSALCLPRLAAAQENCADIDRTKVNGWHGFKNNCSQRISVKWFDQGSCSTGCMTTARPGTRASVTSFVGPVVWATCFNYDHPSGFDNADAREYSCGKTKERLDAEIEGIVRGPDAPAEEEQSFQVGPFVFAAPEAPGAEPSSSGFSRPTPLPHFDTPVAVTAPSPAPAPASCSTFHKNYDAFNAGVDANDRSRPVTIPAGGSYEQFYSGSGIREYCVCNGSSCYTELR